METKDLSAQDLITIDKETLRELEKKRKDNIRRNLIPRYDNSIRRLK